MVFGSVDRGSIGFGWYWVGYPIVAYPPIRSSLTCLRHVAQSNPWMVPNRVPISGVLPIAIRIPW